MQWHLEHLFQITDFEMVTLLAKWKNFYSIPPRRGWKEGCAGRRIVLARAVI